MSGVAYGNAPGAAADPILGKLGPLALDGTYRLRVVVESMAGSRNLTTDGQASPTTAVDAASFLVGYNQVAGSWDRIRTVGVQNNYPLLNDALPMTGALYSASVVVAWDLTNSRDARVRCNVYGAMAVQLDPAGASPWSAFDNIDPTAVNAQPVVVPIGRVRTAALGGTNGRTAYPSLDTRGSVQVSTARPDANLSNLNNASPGVVGGPSAIDTAAAILKASAGFLQSFRIVNKEPAATGWYVQVFDLAGAPAANAVPIWETWLAQNGVLAVQGVEFSMPAHRFANGIVIGISSTPALYTAAVLPKNIITGSTY